MQPGRHGTNRAGQPRNVDPEVRPDRARRHVGRQYHERGPALGSLGDGGDRVCEARALVHGHDSWPPGDPGPAVGHARGTALVPCRDEPGATGDQRVRDMKVAAADYPEDSVGAEVGKDGRDRVADEHQACSTRASTREGLPEPPTIGSGPAMTTEPVVGSLARFCNCVSPYFPAPSSEA